MSDTTRRTNNKRNRTDVWAHLSRPLTSEVEFMHRLVSRFAYGVFWVVMVGLIVVLLGALNMALRARSTSIAQQSQTPNVVVRQTNTPNRDANPTGEPEEEPTPGPAETAPPSTPGVFTPPPAPEIPTPSLESPYHVRSERNLIPEGSPLSISDWSPQSDSVLLNVYTGNSIEMKDVPLPSGVLAQYKPVSNLTLLEITAEGKSVPLFENAEDGVWSPMGTEIAFRRYLKAAEAEIYVMLSNDPISAEKVTNADLADFGWVKDQVLYYAHDSRLQQLDLTTKQNIQSPDLDLKVYGGDTEPKVISFSKNGQKLAYGKGDELIIMDANGNEPRTISTSFLNQRNNLAWSPDNQRIAYVEYVSQDYMAIKIHNIESGQTEEVLRDHDEIGRLSWFPKSNAILFNLHQGGSIWLVNVIELDDHQLFSLTQGNYPRLSPDGEKIVFQRNENDLWLLTLAGLCPFEHNQFWNLPNL